MSYQNEDQSNVFLPHYINQARLLDLYAILNGGYPEYEEVQNSATQNVKKDKNAEISAGGGFHIFKIAGSANSDFENSKSEAKSKMTHRVQTATSILGLTIKELERRNYLSTIENAKAGSFVLIPVILQVNSIKALLQEAKDLFMLSRDMVKLGNKNQTNKKNQAKDPTLRKIEEIVKVTKELFNTEEIVYKTEGYAVFGNISPANLYESEVSDITNIELQCLAQVKRVFPNGTQLMKNTVFTKMHDTEAKNSLIKALHNLADNDSFEYETTAMTEILGKPVYQAEIVALFQQAVTA
ncbi:DUF6414 family protein [Lancefieldella rimae]|uniref:DUF6414 family protein n=1 Tax=Lancefieldella rimae TaxID=1383 RepID=UPI001CB5D7A3|nr:hypothetical protein [Lancefieldella rimae]MBF4803728.1 hypothetical protein [Lancefieldella rimae]